jgi:hypothetical protein
MANENLMSDGDTIEREYDRRIANASGVNPVFSHAAKEQMRAMIEQIARTDKHLSQISSTNQHIAVKAGFAAEEWHAETFNLDAILKDVKLRASTDKYGWEKRNGIPDIKIDENGKVVAEAQLKYYKDAETTAAQMGQLNPDGTPKYEGMGLIGPADQIDGIKNAAHRTRLKEEAKGTRPGVADAAQNVEDKASANLDVGGVQSTPLDKKGAEAVAKDKNTQAKVDVENRYKTKSTTLKMKEAAVGAAAMSAIVAGTVNVVRYTQMVRDGELNPSEAVVKIAGETAAAAADSAVKAAAATGVQSLIVRYGSEELVRKMAGQSIGVLARSNAVSIATVCAIDAIKDIVLFSAGKISAKQLEERAGKNILNTSAATMGGSLGALVCGGLAAGTFTAAALPIIGGLAGGLIASMAMDLAIENGIEAPYRELVANTALLREANQMLVETSERFAKGQKCFERFLIEDAELESAFQQQQKRSEISSQNMRSAIDKI